MNFNHTVYNTTAVLSLTGIGEYGDDVKIIKSIAKLVDENISTVAVDFTNIDTINSAAVAAILYLLKYADKHSFDVVFFGANDKIFMLLERAMPKYSINIFTENDFYKRYNIAK